MATQYAQFWRAGTNSFSERMNNVDPDFRQMALYDLNALLTRDDVPFEQDHQNIAVTKVLSCFTPAEKNTEVVNNAVRVAGPLMVKLTAKNQETFLSGLAKVICSPQPSTLTPMEATALRENAAMSLKLVLQTVMNKGGAITANLLKSTGNIAVATAKTIASGLSSLEPRVKSEVFDVLADFSDAYSKDLAAAHPVILDECLREINGDSSSRKRATNCLAKLAPHLADEAFANVTSVVTSGLCQESKSTRKYVEVCNAICRTSAARFDAQSVNTVVTKFLSELQRLMHLPEDQRDSRESDETREQILSALDCFVANCRDYVEPLIEQVLRALQEHLTWDPNYCVPDNEEEEAFEYEDDEPMDLDDGDTSWKVRIASARCLARIVSSYGNSPSKSHLVASVLQVTLVRLGERVEQVRLAIMDIVLKLIEVCRGSSNVTREDSLLAPLPPLRLARPDLAQLILASKSIIVDKLVASAKHRDVKVKLGSVNVLKELVAVFGVDLASSLAVLVSTTVSVMASDSRHQLPILRPECLALLHRLVVVYYRFSSGDETVVNQIRAALPHVLEALWDRFFKTVIASLKAVQQFTYLAAQQQSSEISIEIFQKVYQRLMAQDSDFEIKKAAIDTVAVVVSRLHQQLLPSCQSDVQRLLEHFTQLLASETTRVAVCRAMDHVGQVPNLPPVVIAAMTAELANLLRKTDRQVREAALSALTRLAVLYSGNMTPACVAAIVTELSNTNPSAAFIDEKDLFITSQSLALAATVVRGSPAMAKQFCEKLVPCVIHLLTGGLVQGHALEHAVQFLAQCAYGAPDIVDDLVRQLVDAATKGGVTGSSLPQLSSAGGAVVAGIAGTRGAAAAEQKIGLLTRHANRAVAFAFVGSCGRYIALSEVSRSFILQGGDFNATDAQEDVSAAAALGLGRAAASAENAGALLNAIVSSLQQSSTPGKQQHLLRSLKEAVIATQADKSRTLPLQESATSKAVLQTLLQIAAKNDELLADLVTETVGRLSALCISATLPDLLTAINSGNDALTATAIAALKYFVPQTPDEEQLLTSKIAAFLLPLRRSASPAVRRSCIQLFHTTSLYRPHLLPMNTLQDFLSNLLDELLVDSTLVKEVDLGPFKHRVDNGLELRKITHECTQTLLDSSRKPPNLLSFMTQELWTKLVTNLVASSGTPEEPETEVSGSARSAVIKVARLQPQLVHALGDKIAKKMTATLAAKPKEGIEAEKSNDSIRMAILCLAQLASIVPSIRTQPGFADALKAAEGSDKYREALSLADTR